MTSPDPIDALHLLKLAAVPPAGSGKKARALSQEEARDLTVYYTLNNQLHLEKPIAFGKDGKLSFPKIGEKVVLGLNIGGVHFYPDNAKAAGWTTTGPMDMRTAVLAVRLSQYLASSKWGVSTIYWGGMGVGRHDIDRHGKGFAIDFHGAYTRFGWIDASFDWGKQPITLPSGKPAPGNDWGNTLPYFRLDVGTTAGGFFYDVYHWMAGEAADGPKTPTSIGDWSFILHPDTPDIAHRDSHQDHIHCEIDR